MSTSGKVETHTEMRQHGERFVNRENPKDDHCPPTRDLHIPTADLSFAAINHACP